MQQAERKLIEAVLAFVDAEHQPRAIEYEAMCAAVREYRQLQEAPAPYDVPGREPLATETLIWHPADQPPDADVLVLLHFGSYPDLDEDVYPALYDGEFWYLEGGTRLVKPAIEWAHLPKGARRPGVAHG
jgi:hypothetical protein